uniref:Sulfide dehydrogenase (Flavocytochrome c), cytochrome c subunit n=1 Tax=Candidatus Kentrum sp. TUN TaxID=2126343 RepID=A0A450ZGA5_9GAMM|nr:MAG: sulfide dehydrogenase (flavocytochrome c), cytochrome c subunit [Candidatus Kentron sp. TUN]VFK52835.1 MAG: sulfide dehydrogenase (flavocytochrome c), cytochrome c subunit [Candidatus Kentron sp. TUN]
MGHKTVRNLLLAGSLVFNVSAFADGPSASMLSQPCAGCHGIDGSSVGPASPTIAGMSEDYFLESMNEYRDEERPSTIMGRIAKGYSEDEIEAMATWFSEKSFVHAQQTSDSKKATKGKKLHEKYCEKCHEEGGSLDDGTGVLAGQWIPYLRYSMQDFLSEARVAPKKMKKRVNALVKEHGDQGIEAIVQYYGSQQ